MVGLAPRTFNRMRRGTRLSRFERKRPRTIAAALNPDRPRQPVHRYELHLLAASPIVLALSGYTEKRDVVVRGVAAPRLRAKVARVLNLNHRLAGLLGNVCHDFGGLAIDPMSWEILRRSMQRITRISVEMQQHGLHRMVALEPGKPLWVEPLASNHLFIKAFAHDAHEPVELRRPFLISHVLADTP